MPATHAQETCTRLTHTCKFLVRYVPDDLHQFLVGLYRYKFLERVVGPELVFYVHFCEFEKSTHDTLKIRR